MPELLLRLWIVFALSVISASSQPLLTTVFLFRNKGKPAPYDSNDPPLNEDAHPHV